MYKLKPYLKFKLTEQLDLAFLIFNNIKTNGADIDSIHDFLIDNHAFVILKGGETIGFIGHAACNSLHYGNGQIVEYLLLKEYRSIENVKYLNDLINNINETYVILTKDGKERIRWAKQ